MKENDQNKSLIQSTPTAIFLKENLWQAVYQTWARKVILWAQADWFEVFLNLRLENLIIRWFLVAYDGSCIT